MEEQQPLPCICICLRRTAGSLTDYYDRFLAPSGITTPQYSFLNRVRLMGSANLTELAAVLQLKRSTLSRNAQVLSAAGYISIGPGKSKRDVSVTLTEKGRTAFQTARILWQRAQKEVGEILGGTESASAFLDQLEILQRFTGKQK